MIDTGWCLGRAIAKSLRQPVPALIAAAVMAATQAQAQSCSKGTPQAVDEVWTASKTKSNGATITVFTAPTDHGAQLQISSGLDKSLWVALISDNALLRLSTKGAARIYPTLAANSRPEAVASAASLVYFTEWTTPCAGVLTKSGKLAEFSTGLSETKSTSAAVDAVGNGWFGTDFSGIGKITPKGQISLFGFAGQGNQATAITAGPDGNMWFLEINAPTIGFITPSGSVTEIPTGLANNGSFGIATGSDKRVWFAVAGNNSVAAIVPKTRQITDYSGPFSSAPLCIAAGPDGNMYVGEANAVVAQITPTGSVKEFNVPASLGSFPVIRIVAGPDGNMWFSNNAHAQVGMLKLPVK